MDNKKPSNLVKILLSLVILITVPTSIYLLISGSWSKKLWDKIPTQESTIPLAEWKTYSNTDYKVQLKYPSDFEYKEKVEEETNGNRLSVTFVPDNWPSSNRVKDIVILEVVPKTSGVDVSTWLRTDRRADVGQEQQELNQITWYSFEQKSTNTPSMVGDAAETQSLYIKLSHTKGALVSTYKQMLNSLKVE